MAVKFTKPEINVREKLAELDKPSGIAGEAMLRAETPQEQQALIGVGRRNLLINGDFQVWQRGTSFSSGFTADRWYTAAGTVTKDGLAIKHVATNTDPYLLYKVEDLGNKFDGQDAIASFYLKTSSGINKLQYLTVCNVNYTHDVIYELPSEISGYTRWACPVKITDAHTDYIRIVFELEAVSGNISYLRQVQLEVGKVATPFEHRSYGEELALCQRYYEILKYDTSTDSGGGTAAETLIANGFAYTTTRSLNHLKFNVIKRTQPTVTIVGGVAKIEVLDTTGWVTTTTFTARANIHGTRLDLTHPSSSLTAGNALEVRILSGGYLNIDAEL